MRAMKQAAVGSVLAWLLAPAAGGILGAESVTSIQEAILRAKPATVLVIAEVASGATLDCGSGARRVSPPPFRETDPRWIVDASGTAARVQASGGVSRLRPRPAGYTRRARIRDDAKSTSITSTTSTSRTADAAG